jgi:hypothetical protein
VKILAIVLAIVFVVLAVLAATGIASFSHALGLDGTHHVKHAIVYVVLAILCVIWARFASTAPSAR